MVAIIRIATRTFVFGSGGSGAATVRGVRNCGDGGTDVGVVAAAGSMCDGVDCRRLGR